MTTVDRVYRVHSTVEVPYEKLEQYLDAPDLPAAVERLDVSRRGNQTFIQAVPADDSIGKYTPTATLRATRTDARVYEYEGNRTRTEPSTPDGVSHTSTVETFANFKGRLGTVIKNTALRAPMFSVLHDIARLAARGELTAIVARDGELDAVSVRNGEEVPAAVEITGKEGRPDPAEAHGWQDGRP